jgi:chorismate lyase / 3-hydroxybenzoate synthase
MIHTMLRQYYLDSLSADASLEVSIAALLNKPGVLALVSFDEICAAPVSIGVIPVGTPSLLGKPYEVIAYGDQVAERGMSEGCHWSCIDDVFCAATWVSSAVCRDIASTVDQAYDRLFHVMMTAGYPYPFRIWNFIPNINSGENDHEEYKKFCVGRQRAFSRLDASRRSYPAASALGLPNGAGGVIYVLASRSQSQHHENPRQQPAYEYPRQYGPSSPSFARATSLAFALHHSIFISGTASIVGHATKAQGDLQRQLEITLDNIRHLLDSIAFDASFPEVIRVYLRHAEDLAVAYAYLRQELPMAAINVVRADICRSDLLVEIEAVSSIPVST